MRKAKVCPSCEYEITFASGTNCPRCGFNLDRASDEAYLAEWGESAEREAKLAEYTTRYKPSNTRLGIALVFLVTSSFIIFVIAYPLLFDFFIEIGWYVDSGALPMLSAAICAAPIALGVGTLGLVIIIRASSNRK